MPDPGDAAESLGPETRALLTLLAGGALDLARLERDADTAAAFVRILARLWDFPVGAVPPAPVFSAAWEELEDGR